MFRACLILAGALSCCTLAAFAQPAGTEKKTDTVKGKSKDPAKTKTDETLKSKVPLEKLKIGPNTVVVVVENLLEAMALIPNPVVLTPEKFQEYLDRIHALERQIKTEEVSPSVCKMTGKIDGDYLAIKAEYIFTTEQPRSTVLLGLLGGQLISASNLDGKPARIDAVDKKGFVVRVDKEGTYTLNLNVWVRVDDTQKTKDPLPKVKKISSGGVERSIELGLPGVASGTLQLNLPTSVKELRLNDELEKPKSAGNWLLPIGRSKSLKLAWKEPVSLAGNATLSEVQGHVGVRVDSTHVNIKADLTIDDKRSPTKEWQLLLPPGAEGSAVSLSGQSIPLHPPEGNVPYHIFKTPPGGSERWLVTVLLRVPRPNPGARLAIGPFLVVGALRQHGTISVEMPIESSLGQRLVFHRHPEVTQSRNTEIESAFRYVVPVAEKTPTRATAPPLELEWRYDKNQMETQVRHVLRWTPIQQDWQLDVESRIDVKTLIAGGSVLDLRLPIPRQRGSMLAGAILPGAGYPGAVPWLGMWGDPAPEQPIVVDNLGNVLKPIPQDAFGRVRVVWGGSTKSVIVRTSYTVSGKERRMLLELPRPLNTQDRGAKLTIQSDESMEVLQGPAGAEEAVPERHRYELSWDQAPRRVELAWRPFRREVTATSVADVMIHENTAEVIQTIRFPREAVSASETDARPAQVRLVIPPGVDRVKVVSGGADLNEDQARRSVWVQPTQTGEYLDFVVKYDLQINRPDADKERGGGSPRLDVPLIWPAHVSQKDVKARVWSPAGGLRVRLTDDLLRRGLWKERGIERVKGKDQYPLRVLRAIGPQLPLSLQIDPSTSIPAAAFVAERGLVQTFIGDDGSQHCRVRLVIHKFNAQHLDIELPLPLGRFPGGPTFLFHGAQLTDWETADATEKIIRVKLNPEVITTPGVLEIQYTVPADALESGGAWHTTIDVPRFRPDAAVGRLRWQLTLPTPMLAVTWGNRVRAERTTWGLQGWLPTPHPADTAADLEIWLTGVHSKHTSPPVTFGFAQPSLQPVTIYHLPRPWWMLVCSGLLLILTLGVYFSPAPRFVFGLFLLALAVGVLSVGIFWPASLPTILFGCQPGVLLVAIFLAVHWIWQERTRQQLVFLPAFSQTKPVSTVTLPAPAKRPREPSTVDAPAQADGGPPSSPSSPGVPQSGA